MSRQLNPPWLMWGDSKQLEFTAPVGVGEGVDLPPTGQIIRVDYGRPETWRFLFFAQLLDVAVTSEIIDVDVYFDLVPGLGRVQSTLLNFEHYRFPVPLQNYQQIWSTSVVGPLRDPDDDRALNRVELLTFQSLSVNARAIVNGPNAGDHLIIEVAAYFSPNVHVRPEWHNGMFPGSEDETL